MKREANGFPKGVSGNAGGRPKGTPTYSVRRIVGQALQGVRMLFLGKQAVTVEEADAWVNEFEELEQKRGYFFSSMPIITEATKLSLGAAR